MAYHRIFSLAGFLAFSNVVVSGDIVDERSHPRDLRKRSEVDCGTWVMKCTGIENSCNNACFFRDQLGHADDYIATFRTDVDIDHNQYHSGCSIGTIATTPCTVMPFSQKMQDPFNLTDPACEQFPRADWKQDDFNNDSGLPRNALRCIERTEINAGNDQWNAFRDGQGDQPKRTCTGPMNQPDTDYRFRIEMDANGANQDLLGYCLSKEPQNVMPGEFWMTHLQAPNGQNDFPYNISGNNQYTTGTKAMSLNSGVNGWLQGVIEQCMVKVPRVNPSLNPFDHNYRINIWNGNNEEIGIADVNLVKAGDFVFIHVLDPYENLVVTAIDDMGELGTKGGRIEFRSTKSGGNALGNLLTDFNFTSESQGWDARFKPVGLPGSSKGYYCDVRDIEGGALGLRQDITCYYPCISTS